MKKKNKSSAAKKEKRRIAELAKRINSFLKGKKTVAKRIGLSKEDWEKIQVMAEILSAASGIGVSPENLASFIIHVFFKHQ